MHICLFFFSLYLLLLVHKLDLIQRVQGETEERARSLHTGRWQVNKPGNLTHEAPLWQVDLYTTPTLKSSSLYRGLNGAQSGIQFRWSQRTLLSQGCIFGSASIVRKNRRELGASDRPGSALAGQPVVTCSQWPPPTITEVVSDHPNYACAFLPSQPHYHWGWKHVTISWFKPKKDEQRVWLLDQGS